MRGPFGNSSLLCSADGSAGGRGAAEPAGRPRVLQHPARAGGGRRGALQDHGVPARGPHHAHGERRASGQQGQDHLHHQRQEVGTRLCGCAIPGIPTRDAGSFFAHKKHFLERFSPYQRFCLWGSDSKKPKVLKISCFKYSSQWL